MTNPIRRDVLWRFLLFGGVATELGRSVCCCLEESRQTLGSFPQADDNNHSRELLTSQDESIVVYDLKPVGEPDDVTRLQIDNLENALGMSEVTSRDFSLCSWFQIRIQTTSATIFSYAVNDRFTKTFFLRMDPGKLLFVNNYMGKRKFKMLLDVEPLRWYHVCLVFKRTSPANASRSEANHLTIYFDGLKVGELLDGFPFPLNGTLILGQDQNIIAAGFHAEQALVGRISVMLVPKVINATDVENIFQCKVIDPNVNDIKWKSYGHVVNHSANICQSMRVKYILVPFKSNKPVVRRACDFLGTENAIPKSKEENMMLATMLSQADICNGAPFTPKNLGWLGISYDAERNVLSGRSNESKYVVSRLEKTHLASGDVILESDGGWKIMNLLAGCPLCYGKPSGKVYLFGLCGTGENPLMFYPKIDQKGFLYLYSSTGLAIRIHNHKWFIIDEKINETVASTFESVLLGIRYWDIYLPNRHCYIQPVNAKVALTLSFCSLDEFTCENGECIPMEKRCDSHLDCIGNNDEDDCRILTILDEYDRTVPPPQMPLNVLFHLNLVKVSSVNIIAETLQVTTIQELQWKDERLNFTNLSNDTSRNSISYLVQSIWHPTIQVLNEEALAGTAKPMKSMLVIRTHSPERINQNYRYRGFQNPLEYRLRMSNYISCKFKMADFPFDVQHCWMNISISNLPDNSIAIEGKLKANLEDLRLTEYEILATNLSVKGSLIDIGITLRRLPEYHLLSSYLPVALLHLLSYGTLFISASDFQDRGSMSLVSLLVLISFYSDSAASLPKTSYLKYIDTWYIFSIVFVSLIVIVHLITNNVEDEGRGTCSQCVKTERVEPRESKPNPLHQNFVTSVSEITDVAGKKRNKRLISAAFVLYIARIAFAVAYLIFHISYWTTVFF